MGKSLDRRARIIMNKMNLERNELLYLCLVFNWAASGIISAEFARVVDPRSRPVKHETQIKQFIALKVHFIRENPCLYDISGNTLKAWAACVETSGSNRCKAILSRLDFCRSIGSSQERRFTFPSQRLVTEPMYCPVPLTFGK